MKRRVTKAGVYYEQSATGELRERGPLLKHGERAGVWVCRRVADFPGGKPPNGGATTICASCWASVVFDPARQGQVAGDPPKVCMQCAGIEPAPFPH